MEPNQYTYADDDTNLRVEALNFALRYGPPSGPASADVAVQDAEKYLTFLKGQS